MTARSWIIVAALALGLAGSTGTAVSAQSVGSFQQGDTPLEINADEGIEWRRDSSQYIARGNARAARGGVEVFADVLTAHYRKDENGDTEIYQIDAQGNVRIVSARESVYGDLGRYDVDRKLMVLWGDNLRLETDSDLVTARDSLEYWEERRLAVARGDAVAIRADKRVRADILTAYLSPDAEGELAISQVDAKGNVQISSPSEYAQGNEGVYYVDRELATLSGGVKITRGENQLNGEYAEVNMQTGVSKLLGAPPGLGGDTRVRGLLVPRRKPENEGES